MKHSILETALNTVFSWILRAAILANIIYVITTGDYVLALPAMLALFLSCVPMMLQKNYRISLPWEIDFLVTFALFLHVVPGETMHFYDKYPFWDKLMHLLGTALVGILGFMGVYALHFVRKIKLTLPLICFFTIIFSIAVGALWEIAEFSVDQLLGRHTQYDLDNTMWDLINNTIAGIIAGLTGMIYTHYVGSQNKKRFNKTVREALGLK